MFFVISFKEVFNNLDTVGHDFYAYYRATFDFNSGINPYLDRTFLQYRYFPVTLYFFKFFTMFEYSESLRLFLLLKIFIFFLTITFWVLFVFVDYKLKTFFVLISTFGFKYALFIDFNSGNITVFELFALSLAFILLLRNKIILYCLIIIILALFKVQLIAFIFIPLIKFERKNAIIIFTALISCVILFAAYYIFEPALTKAYINQINTALDEKGLYWPNMGSLQLINTFIVPKLKPVLSFSHLNYFVYILWLTIITAFSLFIIKNTNKKAPLNILISYFVIVYALTVPRLQDYTYLLMIVPSVFVIQYCLSNKILKSLLCLLICTGLLGYYLPVIVVLILYALCLIFFYRVSSGKISLEDQLTEIDKSGKWISHVSNSRRSKSRRLIFASLTAFYIISLSIVYINIPKSVIFPYNSPLDKKELEVSKLLSTLHTDFLNIAGTDFLLTNNFYAYREMIDTSRIIGIFKTMPKGGLLNLHAFAGNKAEWIVKNLTYMDNSYIYIQNDKVQTYGSMMFFNNDSVPDGWRSIKELRETGQVTDDSLSRLLIVNETFVDSSEINKQYEDVINRLGLIYYEPAFKKFTRSLFESLIEDGIQYVELRADLSRVYDLTGKKYKPEEVLLIYKEIIDEAKIRHPEFNAKIIYSSDKEMDEETVRQNLFTSLELRKKYPDIFAGFGYDVGNENKKINSAFPGQFTKVDSAESNMEFKLPYFFDFSGAASQDYEIIGNVLKLNPKRIANIFNLSSYPELELEVKDKHITVEACPISNLLHGFVNDLRLHPAGGYLTGDLPVTINSGNPMLNNYNGLTYDYFAVYMAWGLDLSALKNLILNSLNYSSMNEDDKKDAVNYFNEKWDKFINELYSSLNAR
ncbi:MAG: Adenosine deaminase [Ignavibacteria bacterium]|nr:Adenosine deaminase [Ignavibacteria bacterium]